MASPPLPVTGTYPRSAARSAWPDLDRVFSDHLLAAYGGDLDLVCVEWIVSANLGAMGMDSTGPEPLRLAFERLAGRERAASMAALAETGDDDGTAYLELAQPPFTPRHLADAEALLALLPA